MLTLGLKRASSAQIASAATVPIRHGWKNVFFNRSLLLQLTILHAFETTVNDRL